MKTYKSVAVIGSVAYDEIMSFPSLFEKHLHPDSLDHINVSFVVSSLEKKLGGTATNIVYNLSLVAKTPIKIISGVGKDHHDFLNFFKKHRINTAGLYIDEDLYTATGKVITDANGNQIWGFYYGASASAQNIDLSRYVSQSDIAVLSATHEKPFLKSQNELISLGVDYLYDPGMSLTYLSKEDLWEGLTHAKWLVGNEYEIGHILKVYSISMDKLLHSVPVVITTLGEKGVRYQSQERDVEVPAYPVGQIADPTGAGDAWRAGYVSGILTHKSLHECLKIGNVLASFVIESTGTIDHVISPEEIEARLDRI